MNFIEQLFRVSPDADTGSLELVLYLVPIVGLLAAVHWWRKTRTRH